MGWWEWHGLPAVVRGRIRAHLVERAAYQRYEMAANEPDKKPAGGGFDGFMQGFWGKSASDGRP